MQISNYMCFKNGKQVHIINCLPVKLINMIITWLLNSYLCEKQLKYKENMTNNLNFVTNKLYI